LHCCLPVFLNAMLAKIMPVRITGARACRECFFCGENRLTMPVSDRDGARQGGAR
jgi:hypothetical protein